MAYMLINNTAQGSEDCRATTAEVKVGTTAITNDSDDEVVEGRMPDNGAVSITLNAGKTYIIPKGYHNGNGTVTANSLASQTIASAPTNAVLRGYTFYNRGKKTGTMDPTAASSLDVGSIGSYNFTVYWTNPTKGPYTGVEVYCDNTLRYRGYGSNRSKGGRSSVYIDGLSCAAYHSVKIRSYILVGGIYRYTSFIVYPSSIYCPSPCCVSNCCIGACGNCANCKQCCVGACCQCPTDV